MKSRKMQEDRTNTVVRLDYSLLCIKLKIQLFALQKITSECDVTKLYRLFTNQNTINTEIKQLKN